MTEIATTHNMPEYKVSEISAAIKHSIEDRFGYVRVRGEISGWKIPASGHAYFRLKDENAVLDAVCWKGTISKLNFKPEDGLEVVVIGKITAYAGKSSYQIIAEKLEPAGIGALMALLEERKQKLTKEGLFDSERKKPLPFLPKTIGVITSPTGAVIRDILHRISDRCGAYVLVWPVAVQGEGAAEQIAEAIYGFNQLNIKPDVLIVARGGGSLEDLWAFNEEIVIRAVASSNIPIISAVGHETDTTLIDFAADKRAPTPTAAAEMAVPVAAELLILLKKLGTRLDESIFRTIYTKSEKLENYVRALPKLLQLADFAAQKLDDLTERLNIGPGLLIARKAEAFTHIAARLSSNVFLQKINSLFDKVSSLTERIVRLPEQFFLQKEQKLALTLRLLEAMNVSHVLKRGFVIAKNSDGKAITTAKTATGEISFFWHDGEKKAKI